jgi:hypothetical protein
MATTTPDGLMYQVISKVEEMNHVAARLGEKPLAVFEPLSLRVPRFMPAELGFLRTVSYLFVLYNEVGKVGVRFLQDRLDTYSSGHHSHCKKHFHLVRSLRTYLQHNLNPKQDHDRGIQETAENWLRAKCGTPLPGTEQQWLTCLLELLLEASQFMEGLSFTVRGIETDESREAICRAWQNQIDRNHPPGEFDKLIAEVAIDMGRDNIDAVRIRNRFYDQWEQELSLLEPNYEFRTEARKLIERALLSSLSPVLPITGRDIMEKFGISPGPKVGRLLADAQKIYSLRPCGREDLMELLTRQEKGTSVPDSTK